jgi:uncharacterized protein
MSVLARVRSLHTYPIKGCAGTADTTATVGRRGFAFDREWMVVDEDGQFITQRQEPSLARVRPTLRDDLLTIGIDAVGAVAIELDRSRGSSRLVSVWRDRCVATDEGDEVAALLSEHLGRQARLVRMADGHRRGVPGTDSETGFADAFPLLIISKASLADLNTRIVECGGQAVPMERFRPNIVLDGCEAHAEDAWSDIKIGEVTFQMAGPCERCTVTTVDQSTGAVLPGGEPLATLATYRRGQGGVIFGQNAVHRGAGVVNAMEPVHAA